jgi:hypothetical protein
LNKIEFYSNKKNEEGVTLEDFEKKLFIQPPQASQTNNPIENNYSILSSKTSRIGRIMGTGSKLAKKEFIDECKKSNRI